MCCGGPAPPDPYRTAQLQLGINRDAIAAGAQFSQVNQNNPFGSLTWTGDYNDPNNPRTQNVSLDPRIQSLLDGQIGVSGTLTDAAQQRLTGLSDLGQFQLPESPNFYLGAGASNPLQTSFDKSGPLTHSVDQGRGLVYGVDPRNIQTSLDTAGVQKIAGPNAFADQIKQAQDAVYGSQSQYVTEDFDRQQQALTSRLAAQGIEQGTPAWNDAMQQVQNQRQQTLQGARNAATTQGFGVQQGLFGENLAGSQEQFRQALQSGQFGNEAQMLSFGQGVTNAGLNNAAAGQQFGQNFQNAQLSNAASNAEFGQNQALAQFYNQAQGQQFNQGLQLQNYNRDLYQQNLQNNILGRNQNFNEAAAFLNGSPVAPANPNFQGTQQYQGAQASPNAIGLAGSNYAAGTAANAAMMGSIFGAAGNVGAAAAACWVAREVYGAENPRWLQMREWMLTKAPEHFRRLYLTYGERIAEMIRDNNPLKALIRSQMEAVLNG